MTIITTGHARRADIRAAAARGAAFLDRAWPGSWAADVHQPVTWWSCPLHQLGRLLDVEPAEEEVPPAARAAFALGLAEGEDEQLGFWFPLEGVDRVDEPLVRAWCRAWRQEIESRRRGPRPARVRKSRAPRGPRSRPSVSNR